MLLNEEYLAATILFDENVISGIVELVSEKDFEDPSCRAVFRAAKSLLETGMVVDAPAIQRQARKNGVILSNEYIAGLWDEMPANARYMEYAERVAEEGRTRRIKEMLAAIQYDVTLSADDLLDTLQSKVADMSRGYGSNNDLLSLIKPLTEFDEREPEWLIDGWLPKGQITLLASAGGVGKTTLWVHIISALSTGDRCILDPPGYRRSPRKVLFLSAEESVSTKLKAQLRVAGANMENILTMDIEADHTGLLRDLKFGTKEMAQIIRAFRPDICIFDPVQGFVPAGINMGSRNAMRDCMAPLIGLGEEVGTAFLVVCHTNKRMGASGRDRVADSADLWDISRSVLMAGNTGEKNFRYLSNEKNNYSALQDTVLFEICDGQIKFRGKTWKRDQEYVSENTRQSRQPKREECKEFIVQTLTDAEGGQLPAEELLERAEAYGYSESTYKRARQELKNEGIVSPDYGGTQGKKGRDCYVIFNPDAMGDKKK